MFVLVDSWLLRSSRLECVRRKDVDLAAAALSDSSPCVLVSVRLDSNWYRANLTTPWWMMLYGEKIEDE